MENKNIMISDISVVGNLNHMKRMIAQYELLMGLLGSIKYKEDQPIGISEFAHDLRLSAYELLENGQVFATSDELTEITKTIRLLQQLLYDNICATRQLLMNFITKLPTEIPDIISDFIENSYSDELKYMDETVNSIRENMYQNDISFIRRFCSNCKFLKDNVRINTYKELCKGTDQIFLQYRDNLRSKVLNLKCVDEKNIVKN